MAGSTTLTRTLDQIKTIIGGVSGMDPSRVFQGYKRFSATENYNDMVEALTAGSQGYFNYWLLRSGTSRTAENSNFDVFGELYTYIPKDTSDDLNASIDLCVAIRNALLLESNWPNLNSAEYVEFRFAGLNVVDSGAVATWAFGGDNGGAMTFIGGCE